MRPSGRSSTTAAFSPSIYGGNDQLEPSEFTNRRLIGRSIWNSQWKLIIPGTTLLSDPNQGLDRFIQSVKDIKLYFITYSYAATSDTPMRPLPAECRMQHNGSQPHSRALRSTSLIWGFLAGLFLLPRVVPAYPPAPYHLFYGLVRDEYGTPLGTPDTQVVLETRHGGQDRGRVARGTRPDRNFELRVPMDSGLTPVAYKSTALTFNVAFKIYILTGLVTNTPIQMMGDYAHLGEPGQSSRVDLTLGDDANHDGIPDDWEYAVLAALGSQLALSQINANSVLTADGRTLLQEFLLGVDPLAEPTAPTVALVNFNAGSPLLEFSTTSGRTYAVMGSADLRQWLPLSFRNSADGPNGPAYTTYSTRAPPGCACRSFCPRRDPAPSTSGFNNNKEKLSPCLSSECDAEPKAAKRCESAFGNEPFAARYRPFRTSEVGTSFLRRPHPDPLPRGEGTASHAV